MRYQTKIAAIIFLFAGSCISTPAQQEFGPSIASVHQNAPQIFNAVHNAMRQFGSSLHHNGMSFFQATIPKGTILYHGSPTNEVPQGLEWLAFEIEHSENFAFGTFKKKPNDTPLVVQDSSQRPLDINSQHAISDKTVYMREIIARDLGAPSSQGCNPAGCDDGDDEWIHVPGYLHIYQAARPLKVLYLDGMAAGKTNMGTNDAEDYILTGNKSRHGFDDMRRADDLCDWAKTWEIDGFIRMEPGFEVVYCNFGDGGVHQVSATRHYKGFRPMEHHIYQYFQWVKAASQRYYGIGGGRVRVDYASMVSAYFYPLNLTNPNITMAEHPRLSAASLEELAVIRKHVERMTPKQRQKSFSGVDWQGVTDLVVTRYADRLALMATYDSVTAINVSLHHLIDTHIAYLDDDIDFDSARRACASHYLAGAIPETAEEEFIYAGILGTTELICKTLFDAHSLVEKAAYTDHDATREALSLVKDLMDKLRWSEWKQCGPCKMDEVCFIAMWPFGNTEDHYNPSCHNASTLVGRDSYWRWEWW
ncbi:hypothetical protein BKA67DRAFT_553967 [Truncatella angustata]|uniref:Uncharacterized protein n=1 Tax=Truncatella angustata TaxID=152316 RepID=A0A9P8UQA6_9PEZI|nr:uncharacterized protein BKA67DRAFT_553967 [Truncatella angustata]KAH6657010.1 hypothetical protein BKA67DRAFT_553967 [Truncatella angustata]